MKQKPFFMHTHRAVTWIYALQTSFSKSREIPRKDASHRGPSTHLSSDWWVVNTWLDRSAATTSSYNSNFALKVQYVRILVRNNHPEMIDMMWRAVWHYVWFYLSVIGPLRTSFQAVASSSASPALQHL